jgi:hypothetical protein
MTKIPQEIKDRIKQFEKEIGQNGKYHVIVVISDAVESLWLSTNHEDTASALLCEAHEAVHPSTIIAPRNQCH